MKRINHNSEIFSIYERKEIFKKSNWLKIGSKRKSLFGNNRKNTQCSQRKNKAKKNPCKKFQKKLFGNSITRAKLFACYLYVYPTTRLVQLRIKMSENLKKNIACISHLKAYFFLRKSTLPRGGFISQ